jgi:hypothetical protein
MDPLATPPTKVRKMERGLQQRACEYDVQDTVVAYGCPVHLCKFEAGTKAAVLGHLRTQHKFTKRQVRTTFIRRLLTLPRQHRNQSVSQQTTASEQSMQAAVPADNTLIPSPAEANNVTGAEGKDSLSENWDCGNAATFSLFPKESLQRESPQQFQPNNTFLSWEKEQLELDQFRRERAARMRAYAQSREAAAIQNASRRGECRAVTALPSSIATSAAAAECVDEKLVETSVVDNCNTPGPWAHKRVLRRRAHARGTPT